MLPFDNNMMLMIAVALVIAAVAYMYRDLEKTKSDLSSLKSALRPAPQTQVQTQVPKRERETAVEKSAPEDEVSD